MIKLYKHTYEYGEPTTVSAKPTEVVRTQATDYAPVKSMKGNTVKWNQLVANGDFSNGTTGWSKSTTGSWSIIDNNVLRFDTGTTQYNREIYKDIPTIQGNKYLFKITAKCSSNSEINIQNGHDNTRATINLNTEWGTYSVIISNFRRVNTDRFEIQFNPVQSNLLYYVKNIQLIDLTAIGIADQINSVSDFNTWLAANVGLKDYYPYDAGSLLSVNTPSTVINDKEYLFPITTLTDINGTVMFPNGLRQAGDVKDEIDFEHGTAVKRVGVVDLGSLIFGYVESPDNNYFISRTNISNFKNYNYLGENIICSKYPTIPNGIASLPDKAIRYYNTDNGGILIRDDSYSNGTTFQTAMQGVMLYYELAEPVTYHFDTHVDLKKRYVPGICNAKGSTEVVGAALVPYNEFNNLKGRQDGVENAAFVTIFPDGMKKAGNVYDEIKLVDGVWKAVKRVGSVDLGSQEWYADVSLNNLFSASLNTPKVTSTTSYANIKTAVYPTIRQAYESSANNDCISGLNWWNGIAFWVKSGTSYTTSTLRTAMQGVILYYELDTPITYTIDASSIDIRAVSEVRIGDTKLWENKDGYGVKINTSTGECTRIGNMEYHKTLPIQSRMRRCIVGSDDSVRYVHPDNYLVDTEGNAIDYTVSEANGVTYDVMVEIPEHYYDCYQVTEDGTNYDIIMLYPEVHKGKKVPLHYMGAFKAAVKRNVTSGVSTAANEKLFSTVKAGIVYNSSGGVNASDLTYTVADREYYRGGNLNNEQSSWDNDKQKSLIGKPVTQRDISEFATMAKNRGSKYMMLHWAARNCLNRLFVVEYATLNSQATFNSALDSNGYHQGGLGAGVSTVFDGNAWNTHNSYYPVIPCGVTLRLGSNTGVVQYNLSTGTTIDGISNFSIPSYRGVESPFGDIWEMCNGVYIYGADNKNYIYTAVDGWHQRDFLYNSSTTVKPGFQLKSNTVPISTNSPTYNKPYEGWITSWKWDSDGDFVPTGRSVDKDNTADTNSPLRDYFWGQNTGAKRLMVGGALYNPARTGLFAFICNSAVASRNANHGSRLLKVVG